MTLASSRPVRIQICGMLAIERDGQRLEGGLPGRQGRLLFTYLVVNRHRHVPRDELAEALGVYGQLSECLREQLGVSPSPATRELYERLLAAT